MMESKVHRLVPVMVFAICFLAQGCIAARLSEALDLSSSGRGLKSFTVNPTGTVVAHASGPTAYFNYDLTGNPTATTVPPPSTADGYCVDLSHFITPGQQYCAKFCSTLDPRTPFTQCIQSITGTTYVPPNVNYNIDGNRINWIINNFFEGQADGESGCADTRAFKWQDIQAAIWLLTNPTASWSSINNDLGGVADQCKATYIFNAAKARGAGFVPDKCYQLFATFAVVYRCNTASTGANVQLVFYYTRLDVAQVACVPWPQCTQPQLPRDCIGQSWAAIQALYTADATLVPPAASVGVMNPRNLSCTECLSKTGKLPQGCDCPYWPCCGPNIDPYGYNCPMCPAVAITSAFTKSLAGPGGCAAGLAWMSGGSVADSFYYAAVRQAISAIIDNDPPSGTRLTAYAQGFASAIAQATAKAVIRYYQLGCVCKGSPGYSSTQVQASITGVALAVAEAYVETIASIWSSKYGAYVAYVDSTAGSLAASVNTAVLNHFNQAHYLPGQCTTATSMIQTEIVTNVTAAIACSVANSLAAAYYFPTNDPTNPTPLGSVDSCSCSVSLAVGGNPGGMWCALGCPTSVTNPVAHDCYCAVGAYNFQSFQCPA